ncbi:MAG: DUF4380 domain-containing protein [Planctomycetota bacterium]
MNQCAKPATPACLACFLLLTVTGCITTPAATPDRTAPRPSPAALADGFGVSDDGQTLTFPDTITLTNGSARLGVSPTAGRAVVFGTIDGPNLLWHAPPKELANWRQPRTDHPRKPYANLGGDKVWLLPQGRWPIAYGGQGAWPPDGVIDGQPWTRLNAPPNSITIQSPICPATGIQLTRTFTLNRSQPIAVTTTTATKRQPSSLPINIWTVTQIINPDHTLLHRTANSPPPINTAGWVDLVAGRPMDNRVTPVSANTLRFQLPAHDASDPNKPPRGGKIGTLGRWVAAVYPDLPQTPRYFVQTITVDPDAMYLDASNLQVYHENRYTELETLSPGVHLQPGESLQHTVVWQLTDQLPTVIPATTTSPTTAPATAPATQP